MKSFLPKARRLSATGHMGDGGSSSFLSSSSHHHNRRRLSLASGRPSLYENFSGGGDSSSMSLYDVTTASDDASESNANHSSNDTNNRQLLISEVEESETNLPNGEDDNGIVAGTEDNEPKKLRRKFGFKTFKKATKSSSKSKLDEPNNNSKPDDEVEGSETRDGDEETETDDEEHDETNQKSKKEHRKFGPFKFKNKTKSSKEPAQDEPGADGGEEKEEVEGGESNNKDASRRKFGAFQKLKIGKGQNKTSKNKKKKGKLTDEFEEPPSSSISLHSKAEINANNSIMMVGTMHSNATTSTTEESTTTRPLDEASANKNTGNSGCVVETSTGSTTEEAHLQLFFHPMLGHVNNDNDKGSEITATSRNNAPTTRDSSGPSLSRMDTDDETDDDDPDLERYGFTNPMLHRWQNKDTANNESDPVPIQAIRRRASLSPPKRNLTRQDSSSSRRGRRRRSSLSPPKSNLSKITANDDNDDEVAKNLDLEKSSTHGKRHYKDTDNTMKKKETVKKTDSGKDSSGRRQKRQRGRGRRPVSLSPPSRSVSAFNERHGMKAHDSDGALDSSNAQPTDTSHERASPPRSVTHPPTNNSDDKTMLPSNGVKKAVSCVVRSKPQSHHLSDVDEKIRDPITNVRAEEATDSAPADPVQSLRRKASVSPIRRRKPDGHGGSKHSPKPAEESHRRSNRNETSKTATTTSSSSREHSHRGRNRTSLSPPRSSRKGSPERRRRRASLSPPRTQSKESSHHHRKSQMRATSPSPRKDRSKVTVMEGKADRSPSRNHSSRSSGQKFLSNSRRPKSIVPRVGLDETADASAMVDLVQVEEDDEAPAPAHKRREASTSPVRRRHHMTDASSNRESSNRSTNKDENENSQRRRARQSPTRLPQTIVTCTTTR